VAFFTRSRIFVGSIFSNGVFTMGAKVLHCGSVGFPQNTLMGDGCGGCIGGRRDVGANGAECGALKLGRSPVVYVSFHTLAALCVLYA
jgi:hypothetical protein